MNLKEIKSKTILNKATGCHEWQKCINTDGYARATIKGNCNIKVHRLVYSLAHPKENIIGKIIRHKCDNKICVNPKHLLSGAPKDNSLDRDKRARSGTAKLNVNSVKTIRKMYSTGKFLQKELAIKFNVDSRTINYIVLGKTWKHI